LLQIASIVQAKADGRYTAIFNSYSETFETKRTKQQILVFCWLMVNAELLRPRSTATRLIQGLYKAYTRLRQMFVTAVAVK
jgi:hypothetical protein